MAVRAGAAVEADADGWLRETLIRALEANEATASLIVGNSLDRR
jgi:hypothetical protein